MVDTTFMERSFSLDVLEQRFSEDIKTLRQYVQNPSDETKLQTYYQAATAFKKISTKDIVKLITGFRGNLVGKPAAMRNAFPVLLGDRITQPSQLDLAYLQLFLAYATDFKTKRANLNEWLLRFLLSNQFSPFYMVVETQLNNVVTNIQQKIAYFQSQLK
ncbi:MAG: hypothetical protein JSS07_06055 [Proteobacteria bacterium]|nr:hypothetical protein [Pseudomonadota bacterium]